MPGTLQQGIVDRLVGQAGEDLVRGALVAAPQGALELAAGPREERIGVREFGEEDIQSPEEHAAVPVEAILGDIAARGLRIGLLMEAQHGVDGETSRRAGHRQGVEAGLDVAVARLRPAGLNPHRDQRLVPLRRGEGRGDGAVEDLRILNALVRRQHPHGDCLGRQAKAGQHHGRGVDQATRRVALARLADDLLRRQAGAGGEDGRHQVAPGHHEDVLLAHQGRGAIHRLLDQRALRVGQAQELLGVAFAR